MIRCANKRKMKFLDSTKKKSTITLSWKKNVILLWKRSMGAAEVTHLVQEFATSTIKRFKRKEQSLLNSSNIFRRLKCSKSISSRTINKTLRIKTWETLIGLTHLHLAKANAVIQSLEWLRRTEVGEYQCLTEWDRWTTFQARAA